MTYNAASLQGAMEMLWLHFGGAVMLSILFTVNVISKITRNTSNLRTYYT